MSLDHIHILREGGIGVLPTDTLYGLVGRALAQIAVDRIYELKQRPNDKPCIILISHSDELAQFGVELTEQLNQQLSAYWPGPVSIVLPINRDDMGYLDRGTKTLAFRIPDEPDLIKLLELTGPLLAPSANPDSQPPATTIKLAHDYFGNHVDFYVDGGQREGKASRVIKIDAGKVTILRD